MSQKAAKQYKGVPSSTDKRFRRHEEQHYALVNKNAQREEEPEERLFKFSPLSYSRDEDSSQN